MSAEAYARQLKELLPSGAAWRRDGEAVVSKVLLAIADALARLDARAKNLMDEFDPRTTLELLPDWERVFDLPDPCVTSTQTIQQRRNAIVAKMTNVGGQSRAYFIALAAALGYEITITEFRPFKAGRSRAGDALTNGDWVFAWRVNAPEATIFSFRAGQSAAGERLRTWGNQELECAIAAKKPAHTHVIFAYGN